jgi:hypothetical protein
MTPEQATELLNKISNIEWYISHFFVLVLIFVIYWCTKKFIGVIQSIMSFFG